MISTDLANIADTLDARATTADALAPAECAGLAAALRSLADRAAHMEEQPVPERLMRLVPALVVIEGGRV